MGACSTASKASSTSPLCAISLKANPRDSRRAMAEMVAMKHSVHYAKSCLQFIK